MRRTLHILVLLAAIASAALAGAAPASASVDDFSYSSWDVEYVLSRDDDGRASAHVTETLVADFPDTDQNRGIVRGLLRSYQGAPIFPAIESITDENGDAVPYDEETEDDMLYLLLGDDEFQHGETTYVIRYTMHDVFHQPDDAAVDEFYWDLIPQDRAQPIDDFSATITFDETLAAQLTGASSCYTGTYGQTERCEIQAEESSGSFTIVERALAARTNVTVAFALEAGTVTPSPAHNADALTDVVPLALAGAGIVAVPAIGFGALGLLRRRHRAQGQGIVVAQYDVPSDLPPLLAARIHGRKQAAVAAEIVHLGVHGAIRIADAETTGEDGGKARRLSAQKKPTLHLVDPSAALDPLDAQSLRALFPHPTPGTALHLSAPNDAVAARLGTLPKVGHDAARNRGLLTRQRSLVAVVMGALGLALGAAAIVFASFGIAVGRPTSVPGFVLAIIVTIALIVLAIILFQKTDVLTPQGARTREYLAGVEEYIRLAEADRIQMLQSYTGAERRSDGSVDVIVIYERLLPYAMLFGMEGEWSRVLAVHHEQQGTSPQWYAGYAAASLSSSLSRLGSSLTPTPSATSTSSSSSSGSFGGGFSGGGGGGGFSGGR